MARPRVNTNPVANQYAGPDERIIEYSSKAGGGLIAFRVTDDGKLLVQPYRHDDTVVITTGQGVEIWTLTVDGPDSASIVTTVHKSEQEAIDSFVENYLDETDDLDPFDDPIAYATEQAGYVIHIDTHVVTA